jgi:hypothetical protein
MKYSRLMRYIITIYIIHQNKRLMPDFSVAAGLLPCSLSIFLRLDKTKKRIRKVPASSTYLFFFLFLQLVADFLKFVKSFPEELVGPQRS